MFTVLTEKEQECIRKAFKALDMDKYYEVSKACVKMILNDTPYIIIGKKFKIDKHICFGYGYGTSTYEASNSCDKVLTYEGFKQYQLKEIDAMIERFSDWLDTEAFKYTKPGLFDLQYLNKTIPELGQIVIIERCDKNNFNKNDKFKSLDDMKANISDIIEILKLQRDVAEKSVDAYYKRYGTNNIKTWTYDRMD